MQSNQDILQLQVGVRPRFDKVCPTYQLLVDQEVLFSSGQDLESDREYFHDFELEIGSGDHCLSVRFDILPDVYGNIEITSIRINGKYLAEDERYHLAKYHLDTPQEIDGQMTDCYESICLGWPGTYRLPFKSPILFWSLLTIKSVDKRPTIVYPVPPNN